jgi:sigma-E factor negative regulatory protein RseC
MEEIGVVTSVDGPIAKVIVKKKSACDKCSAGTCSITGEGAEIEGLNDAGAKVGQRVRVVLQPYTYVKGSLVIYGLPALALILGAVAGKEFFSSMFERADPDSVSAIFAFAFFALSFLAVRVWSRRAGKKIQYKPVVKEILDVKA